MALNITPIFPGTPSIQWAPTIVTAANTARDGTGAVTTVFTADATNGSRIDYMKIRQLGTSVQTVLRVFINNGLDNNNPANSVLFMERTIPASTLSETTELIDLVVNMGISLPAGYKINVVLGTAIAAGIKLSAVGGNY